MKQQTMKALVYHGNGTLELMERPVPKLKEDTDAIVRVTLSTICTSDLHILRGAVPRAKPETILGHEFVGEIALLFVGSVIFAEKVLSITVSRVDGNLVAGLMGARRNMLGFHMRTWD